MMTISGQLLQGAVRLDVSVGNLEAVAAKARRLRDKYGDGGLQVRVRTDIAWSARDNDWPLPSSEFCAEFTRDWERQMHE